MTTLIVGMVMFILFFGLRPKLWPSDNLIHWLPEIKALSWQFPSIAYVDDLSGLRSYRQSTDFTIHLILAAGNLDRQVVRSMLMLHNGDDRRQLTLWQWGASIIVMNGDDYDYSRRWPRVSTGNALVLGKPQVLTITSARHGSRVFIDGELVREKNDLVLSVPKLGSQLRLILGHSVHGRHGWEGEMYSLAMYGKALGREEVRDQYQHWRTTGRLFEDDSEGLLFHYAFNQGKGRVVRDQSGNSQDLRLPSCLVVLHKSFLTLPRQELSLNGIFWVDVLLNCIAFIPLGAALYLWVSQSSTSSVRYPGLIVVVACFLLSLSMEIAQGWLPARDSSLLDLCLNTTGAWFGVLVSTKLLK